MSDRASLLSAFVAWAAAHITDDEKGQGLYGNGIPQPQREFGYGVRVRST